MALEAEQSYSSNYKQTVEEVEWNRLKLYRLKEGFVGGKSLGEERTLQSGFDLGYINGYEISYPISVIKGLLAVNELLLKGRESSLLIQAEKIKQSLSEFEKKCSEFKLNCIQFMNNHNNTEHVFSDIHNDNVDFLIKEACPDTKDLYNIHKCKLNEINSEFDVLKEHILCFLRECEQPLLVDQISRVFEKWDYQKITESGVCIPKCSDASLVFQEAE